MTRASPVHLSVEGIKKSYGSHQVLNGVSIKMFRGQTNVIIGSSGSGKTVMLRQLTRLERPDAGHIWLDDLDLVTLNDFELVDVRRRFGIVFQDSALFDSMTVFDNVAFPLREHTKLRAAAVREKVMEGLEGLNVEAAAQRMPGQLSGGMRKRVAVARALVLEPEILFYDEPTTGLDPITSRTVDDLIVSTKHRFGVTSIVITHDMESVRRIADHLYFLHKGTIAAEGSLAELASTNSQEVTDFFRASGVAGELESLPPPKPQGS